MMETYIFVPNLKIQGDPTNGFSCIVDREVVTRLEWCGLFNLMLSDYLLLTAI